MYSLSGGCGYCLSNHIGCDLVEGSPCGTCRDYGIQCPPNQEPTLGLDLEIDSPMEEAIHTPEAYTDSRFDLVDVSSPIHWMVPLDHYKSVAHDFLCVDVPGLPTTTAELSTQPVPPFIQGLSASLADEDVQFLASKGVFSLPDQKLRNALLKTFVHHVHPYLPVLDLPVFLEAIANNDGHTQVSLLLFHAVMFSSIAFVDPTHIHRAGYTSRKAARQEFFSKARLLYDLDAERDRIVLIQSVLLMTYWHETPDDPKDFRHWLEIALSQATIVAFPNSSEWASGGTQPGLWKRIWWCMYTRDRLNALNLRREPIISDADFTVPYPTLSDFDIQRYPSSVTRMLGGCEVLRRLDYQQQLAQMFIEKAKFCCAISEIILSIANASTLAPEELTRYIQALEDWQDNLPSHIQYCAPTGNLSEGERTLFAYRAWLKMLFLAASGALHRQSPQRLTHVDADTDHQESQTQAPETGLHSVTRSIAGVAEGLHQLDLVHCLPTTTVGLLMPVLATHFMNIRSETPDLWRNAFQSLYQCLKVLEKLGEVYMLAESMATFFQAAICGDADAGDPARGGPVPGRSGLERDFLERILTSAEMETFAQLVGKREAALAV
ncbi:fungal-specific transcription factor domain-containing protein [Aspergillus pseudodeflectus]|uniref:Fungal-specific transcription factor domain-containing protein n=1 Tax=Aspergillus pseudodeflectus TaxID=176178 RepID=A0ABR4K927_9EURO